MYELERCFTYDVTPISTLVISLADMKEHLRLDSSDTSQDNYLTSLINASTKFFEDYTCRDLLNKTYKTYRDFFDEYIILKKSRVQSITSIKYYSNSVLTTLSNTAYYLTNEVNWGMVFPVSGYIFPCTDDKMQAIEITFVAGYGTSTSSIPADIILAIKNHVAYLYENRGDCVETKEFLPSTSRAIYNQYRIEVL